MNGVTIPRVTTLFISHYRFNIMATNIYFIPGLLQIAFLFLNREGLRETWHNKLILAGNIYTSFISISLLNCSTYKLMIYLLE